MAGEGQIGFVVGTAMLARDDVFDAEARVRFGGLGKAAVFAAIARPAANRIAWASHGAPLASKRGE